MALSDRIKQGFLRLPGPEKAILLASFTLAISPVLPWYDDSNAFGDGTQFLGIQGPLYLIGWIVLGLGALSFLGSFIPLTGAKFFDMNRRRGASAILVAAQALLLAVLANSIFYHPEYGVNVNHKATSFGILVCFASVGVLLMAGYLSYRDTKRGLVEEIDDYEEEAYEPEPEPLYVPQQVHHAPRSYSEPEPAPTEPEPYTAGAGVDPLTLSPKERYKMMQRQSRLSQGARENLWGN